MLETHLCAWLIWPASTSWHAWYSRNACRWGKPTKGSWPLVVGPSEKANSTSSVSMMLSRSIPVVLHAVGIAPPMSTRRAEGLPTPPMGDVAGESR